MTQMFKIDSVDTRKCLGTMEYRACQRKKMVSALTWVVSTLIARKTPVTSPSCPGAGARGPPWGPRRWKSCAITNCKNRHTKRATTSQQHTDGQTVPCQPHAGLPPYIQPSSEPDLHYYLAEQTIMKTMHYLNTWYTNQFNNQQGMNSLPEA